MARLTCLVMQGPVSGGDCDGYGETWGPGIGPHLPVAKVGQERNRKYLKFPQRLFWSHGSVNYRALLANRFLTTEKVDSP